MSKNSSLNIADIESKIAGYRSFFDSTKEVNEQIFHQERLTSSQNAFLEILKEFDNYAKSNRNPEKNDETISKITSYIQNLDGIENEIRIEQEIRLSSNNSSKMSSIFHHGHSLTCPILPEKPKKTIFEKSNDFYFSQIDIENDFEEEAKAKLTDEEIHQKVNQIIAQEKSPKPNSEAFVLFSILSNLAAKNNYQNLILKKESSKDDPHKDLFFQVSIKGSSSKEREKIVRVARSKDGDFAIFSRSHDRNFYEAKENSGALFNKVLKEIYLNSDLKHLILSTKLCKIANGFYIDESGKVVTYEPDKESLTVIEPHNLSKSDCKIIENEVDLESIYQLLTDDSYQKATQAEVLGNKLRLISPKNTDSCKKSFALANNSGLIQIYQKLPSGIFDIAKNSDQILEFAKNLEYDLKEILIFTSFSSALKGNWDLLNKVSLDHRITKKSIIEHINSCILTSDSNPFDINFLAKIAANVPSLNYHVTKLTIENRSHFLPQIIYGHLEPNPYAFSFVIKLFSRHPNFLDSDHEKDEQIYHHHVQESLGFITHCIVNSRDIDFDQEKFANEEDFFISYTNCLSRFTRQILLPNQQDISGLINVIHRSFLRLIELAPSAALPKSNGHLVFPLITKILNSFSHQSKIGFLLQDLMIKALKNAKIDKNSTEFTVIILKICSALIKQGDFSQESIVAFKQLIEACKHNENLVNLVEISLSQLFCATDNEKERVAAFQNFSIQERLSALSVLDFHSNSLDHHPDLSASKALSVSPTYLEHSEFSSFLRSTRRELNLLSVDLSSPNKNQKIAKLIRTLENKYQHSKVDLVTFAQTFFDYENFITKTIITNQDGKVLYRIGDSIYDFVAMPIRYFFAQEPAMLEFLLSEIEILNVAAQDHGLNLNSLDDVSILNRLKPRIKSAIKKIVNHIHQNNPNHPYLTFLKGFNQSSEDEMLSCAETFLEDNHPNQFILKSSEKTLTVKLAPDFVTYQSNYQIEILKLESAPSNPLATLQVSGSISVNYVNNSKITNNSYIHSLKNRNLDIKISDSIRKFIALNASAQQFDDIFYDIVTDPIIANGLNSLCVDEKSRYHKISVSSHEEQFYIPRNSAGGFVFTVNHSNDRLIKSIILHEALYQYDVIQKSYYQISPFLTPANFKELAIRLDHLSKLCRSINVSTRPLRDAFCELRNTKFGKKSQIEEVRSAKQYNFKFRSIGKLESGKKLYLDENGRLLVNTSLSSLKLTPICHPQPHMIEKLPIEEVSPDFDLTFMAQHFDHQKKPFHRFCSTFKVKVRTIGTYQDVKNNIITIYQDSQGRRFKSIKKSSKIQEILDLDLEIQSQKLQKILDSFTQRAAIHEIFDPKKPQELIKNSNEVTIGKIQHLKTSKDKDPIEIRQITAKSCVKSPQKSFHIDRFAAIYTKTKQGRIQKSDLSNLEPDLRKIIFHCLDLSFDNIRLKKIYQLLEKNNSHDKKTVNLKPFNASKAHIFVKNGIKYALFKEDKSEDHHLMCLDYEKGVKKSKTGIIYDPDSIKLITSNLERKALFDDINPGVYLIYGEKHLHIKQEEYFNLTIKSFNISNFKKTTSQDQTIAIDSKLRILYKNPGEKDYNIATYSQSKKLIPYFYQCATESLIKLEDWKTHYINLMSKKQPSSKPRAKNIQKNKQQPSYITVEQLHQQ